MPVKYKSLDGVVKYKDQMTEQELQEFSGTKSRAVRHVFHTLKSTKTEIY